MSPCYLVVPTLGNSQITFFKHLNKKDKERRPVKLILLFFIMFYSNAIQTITGFAGTLIAMPLSIQVIGVPLSKILLNFIAMISCMWIAISNYNNINKRELTKIILLMLIGMVVGLTIYSKIPIHILILSYAILIIIIALKNLCIRKSLHLPKLLLLMLLLMAGVIHGLIISGGALLVIYAAIVFKDKTEFRATMAAVWAILNMFLFGQQAFSGQVNGHILLLCLLSIIPITIGIFAGNYLFNRIKQNLFMALTNILLLFSGLLLLV
ncbi:TSUP family transporter [Terrilactibacillus sp. BCM23-1]|uniref:Probable membrane transporter protein n=1 Tax=Terrilactibacillus tamarindi TaxID=2599694 RepID=A0A6N8CNS6_9BACI|nr:TSUP family transporter [Terrilactibacillus tamarindi]MTT31799.1 TSUP family transporter [Terrilactibacillus tamarindi]